MKLFDSFLITSGRNAWLWPCLVIGLLFSTNGKTSAALGRAPGVPVGSLPTAFARPDGSFVIVY